MKNCLLPSAADKHSSLFPFQVFKLYFSHLSYPYFLTGNSALLSGLLEKYKFWGANDLKVKGKVQEKKIVKSKSPKSFLQYHGFPNPQFLFFILGESEKEFVLSDDLDSSPPKKRKIRKRVVWHDNVIKTADKKDHLLYIV